MTQKKKERVRKKERMAKRRKREGEKARSLIT